VATRFYFPSTTAADVTPATNGLWTYANQVLNRKLVETTASNTAETSGSTIGGFVAGETVLDRRYVSNPLAAQTIFGTAKMQMRARMFNGGSNVLSRIEAYVVSNDGATVRGTLFPLANYAGAAYINSVAHRNRPFLDGDSAATVVAEAGDRLVLCVGHGTTTATVNSFAQAIYGDPTANTDLPEDSTTAVAGFRPWFELSATLTFAPPSTGTVAATEATDVAAAAGREVFRGTVAATEATDVVAVVGREVYRATVAVTEAVDVVAAVGGQPIYQGTVAVAEAADTAAGAARSVYRATVACSEAVDVVAAVGLQKLVPRTGETFVVQARTRTLVEPARTRTLTATLRVE
jgi:hypothetical protein